MNHIFNHNRYPFNLRVDRREHWDFFLSRRGYSDGGYTGSFDGECLSSFIDTSSENCVDENNNLMSDEKYTWEDLKNNGITLNNIGFTGVDNGFLHYKRDRITNAEFIKLFTDSKYEIGEDDSRLHLYKVNGNNMLFNYSNELVEDEEKGKVARLNGGFFQGFFKSGCDYQILPDDIGSGWCIEFTLKREDFEKEGYTLNDRYPENKGTFFFIGTRAENKWWDKFNVTDTFERIYNTYFADDYIDDSYLNTIDPNKEYFTDNKPITYYTDDYFADEYFNTECVGKCGKGDKGGQTREWDYDFTYPEALNCYQDNSKWFNDHGGMWIENEMWTTGKGSGGSYRNRYKCDCSKYFNDGYFADDIEICDCDTDYVRKQYQGQDEYLDIDRELYTDDGVSVGQPNVVDIRTDNKFILFDRTCDGFTVDNWVEGSEMVIRDIKDNGKENYFLLFNRTCNGKTTDSYLEPNKDYDVISDLYRNAFSLQIDDDGKLGYKYLLKDCDSEERYKIETQFTNNSVIPYGEWVNICIRIMPFNRRTVYVNKVKKIVPADKMRLMLYVNGKLVLVSRELPVFKFKELNDVETKQEGVPFNISLGGGTQGLSDVIYYNYLEYPKYVLPLEKNFGGSFIGYINQFRFYTCPKTFTQIKNHIKVLK